MEKIADMDDETWTLGILHQMTFMLAIYNVLNMFDETDDYPLASRTVKAGFITEEEVELLQVKLSSNADEQITMSFEEILVLYTVMDLNAKLMITHKGDKLRKELKLEDNPHPNVQIGFDGLLAASAAMTRSFIKNYEHIPVFKKRMEELNALNDFL